MNSFGILIIFIIIFFIIGILISFLKSFLEGRKTLKKSKELTNKSYATITDVKSHKYSAPSCVDRRLY